MAAPKTRPTDVDVDEFFAAVPRERRRADAVVVDAMMREATGQPPVIWGSSIVGYGSVESPGPRGAPVSWPLAAFSPRKAELVVYLSTAIEPELFEGLGPHRRGLSCLYLRRLDDVDHAVLRRLIERSIELARPGQG